MSSVYFKITDISGKHHAKELKRELDTLSGVISVSVNQLNSTVAVDFDSSGVNSGQIESKIRALGYGVSTDDAEVYQL